MDDDRREDRERRRRAADDPCPVRPVYTGARPVNLSRHPPYLGVCIALFTRRSSWLPWPWHQLAWSPRNVLPRRRRPHKCLFRRRPTPTATRVQLHQILRQQSAGGRGGAGSRDPSLLTRADYLGPLSALAAFLQQHPEIARNPSFFLGRLRIFRAASHGIESLEMFQMILAGTGVAAGVSAFLGVFVWVIRVDHRPPAMAAAVARRRRRSTRSSSIGSQQTRICSRISSRQRDDASWSRRQSPWIKSPARLARRSRASSGRCRPVSCWLRSGSGFWFVQHAQRVARGCRGFLHHRRAGVLAGSRVHRVGGAGLRASPRGWAWSPGRRIRKREDRNARVRAHGDGTRRGLRGRRANVPDDRRGVPRLLRHRRHGRSGCTWRARPATIGSPTICCRRRYYRFLRTRTSFDSDDHRRHYLFRIATNLVRDQWRRARTNAVDLAEASDRADGDRRGQRSAIATLRRIDVTRALDQLKPRERTLLWLAYAQGFSHEEIASQLGLRTASLKALLFRARRRLVTCWATLGLEVGRDITYCFHEDDVVAAVLSRRWDAADDGLKQHAADCEICRDVVDSRGPVVGRPGTLALRRCACRRPGKSGGARRCVRGSRRRTRRRVR